MRNARTSKKYSGKRNGNERVNWRKKSGDKRRRPESGIAMVKQETLPKDFANAGRNALTSIAQEFATTNVMPAAPAVFQTDDLASKCHRADFPEMMLRLAPNYGPLIVGGEK